MKRHILAIMVVFGLLAFASAGWAVPAAVVGGVDPLYVSPFNPALLPNSGDPMETTWIQWVLGADATLDFKTDNFGAGWETVDGTGLWAWQLPDAFEYFYIKIGTGGLPPGTPDHYLFTNVDSTDWAVVDPLATFGPLATRNNFNMGRFSHIGGVGGTTEVPEPSSLLLLGIGMVGVVGFRKKFA
jgi:hypothetical protein